MLCINRRVAEQSARVASPEVTWSEFLRACDRLNFKKALRAPAWRGLDEDNGGYLTLGEFDTEANESSASLGSAR